MVWVRGRSGVAYMHGEEGAEKGTFVEGAMGRRAGLQDVARSLPQDIFLLLFSCLLFSKFVPCIASVTPISFLSIRIHIDRQIPASTSIALNPKKAYAQVVRYSLLSEPPISSTRTKNSAGFELTTNL